MVKEHLLQRAYSTNNVPTNKVATRYQQGTNNVPTTCQQRTNNVPHMEPCGPIWTHMAIWTHMGPYESHMASIWPPYGPIWAPIGSYGPLWVHMGPYESIWTQYGVSKLFVWDVQPLPGASFTNIGSLSLAAAAQSCSGPIWAHTSPYGPI